MASGTPRLPAHTLGVEWALFIGVGLGITLANLVVYLIIIQVFNAEPWLAAAVAFCILIPVHLYSYSTIVFRSGAPSVGTFLRYAAALLVSFLLNVGLVNFFWRVLLAETIAAQVLSLGPAIVANYLLLKLFVFQPTQLAKYERIDLLSLLTIIIAAVSIYLSVASILLYTHPFLHNDDWEFYNDFFFERTLLGSIFGRQNGHLMIGPKAIFFGNYVFLGGRTVTLALVSVGALGLSGVISALALERGIGCLGATRIERIAAASIILSLAFILTAPVTLYWGLGVHNHLAVLGAVGAAFFASGMVGPAGSASAFFGFVASATLSSTSFSTGAAAWALGFAGAFITRSRPLVVAGYFVVGLVGAAVSLGFALADRADGAASLPSLATVARAIPGLIGNSFVNLDRIGLPVELLMSHAVAIGSVGLIIFLLPSLRVLHLMRRKQPASPLDMSHLFFWLVAGFALVAGCLVILGRAGSGIGVYSALYPRFATWPTLFWAALAGSLLLTAREASQRWSWALPAPRLPALAIGLFVLAIDAWVITNLLPPAYNVSVNAIVRVATSEDGRVLDVAARQPEAMVRQIIGDLRAKRVTIYADDWPYLMGTRLPSNPAHAANGCAAGFRILPTTHPDEWTVTGWIWPTNGDVGTIKTLAFVDSDGVVVGLGKPAFGRPFTGDPLYMKSRPIEARIFQAAHLSGLTYLPGISGIFRGYIRLAGGDPKAVSDAISAFGEDASGRWCSTRK